MALIEYFVEFGNSGEIFSWDNIDPDTGAEVVPPFMTALNSGNSGDALIQGANNTADWTAPGGGSGIGDVDGPTGATDEAFARYDGATGKLLQDSVVKATNAGAITGVTTLLMSGALTVGGDLSAVSATLSGDLDVNGQNINSTGFLILSANGNDLRLESITDVEVTIDSDGNQNSRRFIIWADGNGVRELFRVTENEGAFVTDEFTVGTNTFFVDVPENKVAIGHLVPTILLDVNAKSGHTSIGGFAVKLTNLSGGNTVAGELVQIHSGAGLDDGFRTVSADSDIVIGVVYEAGVANEAEAWIVISGIANVLMDAGGSTRGSRIISSSTAGSADVWNVGGAVATHFQEIGHCLETRTGAGLARCMLHFN